MRIPAPNLKWVVALALAVVPLGGCESPDSGGTSSSVYYGVGFSDPWYYGDYNYDADIVVTPPDRGPRPSHPIATPPMSGARPTPMPSIPSAPRPSGRR